MAFDRMTNLGLSIRRYHALARSYLGYLFHRTKAPMPCFFNVDPSSACNLRCVFCPQSDPPVGASFGIMELELFEEIVEQIRRYAVCAGISLSFAGEPLLNRNLPRMVEIVRRRLLLPPHIATNGTLLSRDTARSLIEAGAGSFMIDFCADPAHFESMCPPADWERVRDNIAALGDLIRERDAAVIVKIKDLDWRGETEAARERSLSSLRAIFGDGFPFFYIPYNLHNWAGEFAVGAAERYGYRRPGGARRPRYHPCSHLWLAMNIHADGNVSICCRDTMQGAVVGNVREKTLPEIWNGPAMVRMRELMVKGEYARIPICEHCDRVWTGSYAGGSPLRIAGVFLARRFGRRKRRRS
jgi:radical SAM protein with 4Fe4S-binding SPASM domain